MLHSTDRAHKQCTRQIIMVQSPGHNDRESQIEVKSGIQKDLAGQIDQNRAFLQKDTAPGIPRRSPIQVLTRPAVV